VYCWNKYSAEGPSAAQVPFPVFWQAFPGDLPWREQLERIAARLARAKVNINYVYATGVKGADSLVVLGVSDLNRAGRALGG